MVEPLTKELGERLQNAGYTFLIGENQASNDEYVFHPVRWDIGEFLNECMVTSFEDHAILIISQMLSDSDHENYLNHQVVVPEDIRN